MTQKLIDSILLPEGLKNLPNEQLTQVASELRDELIETMSGISGHFASSLGACELTVALHAAFTSPKDKIIWDVGHQAYIHKMITGRRKQMHTIRKKDGISGFLKRSESEHDVFGAGHAGTSISAGVGIAIAHQATHQDVDLPYTVPVIGDGSITSGMAFEALNHAGHLGLKNFVVVINDNEMSISPNVGAISWLFSKAVTSKCSTNVRARFKNLHRAGYVPDLVYKVIDKVEELTQGFFAGPALLFESFGFRYIGPVDGHNIQDLMQAFENAKTQDVPVVIHTYTVKGKGYIPAEGDPLKWHAVVPFNREKGEFQSPSSLDLPPTYTQVFADSLINLAQSNDKIVAISAAMFSGTGLDKFQAVLPKRCFDVGICEQHAVTMAAGMACQGLRPVVAIYSTFLQRAFDQVVHDVAIQNLPVVFAMDRGGVVGNDGETHQGVFDIAYLRTLPNLVLCSPRDEFQLKKMLAFAVSHNGPVAIRFPRSNGIGNQAVISQDAVSLAKAEIIKIAADKSDIKIALICYGPQSYTGIQIALQLEQDINVAVSVVDAKFAKPLDANLLTQIVSSHNILCTLEDHALMAGFGSAVVEFYNDSKLLSDKCLLRFGLPDEYITHGSQLEQFKSAGLDINSVVQSIQLSITNLRSSNIKIQNFN